ncbi:hypothetical protein [Actinophytocola sp. KF-1]
MGSSRGRNRVGMALAGVALSLAVSAHDAGDEGAADGVVAGRIAADIFLAESVGGFRNIVRLIFLVAASDSSRAGEG